MVMGNVARVIACLPGGKVQVAGEDGVEYAYSLALPCMAKPGDWVLVHTGFIAGRLSEARARELMRTRAEYRAIAS